MSMKLISFVFSFKNEEKNLKELVDRVDKTIKKVVKALEGASKAHAGQAKMLRKVLASPIPKTKKK